MGKEKRVEVVLLLFLFFLAGMLRLSIQFIEKPILSGYEEPSIFKVKVVDDSSFWPVVTIESPRDLLGVKATFRQRNVHVEKGDLLTIFGTVKRIVPENRNPHLTSWRWIKSLEGVHYEIRGKVIEKREGGTFIVKIRRSIRKKIESCNLRHEGIIRALVLGEKGSLDEDVRKTFHKTGTSHILAISGLHMGVIGSIVFLFARWIFRMFHRLRISGDDKRFSGLVSIPFLIFFMFLFGPSPSTIRATIMIGVYMISVFLERERDLVATIALASLLILLFLPHSLFTPSFQLSFTSVLFIVLISKRLIPFIERVKNRFLRWVLMSFVVSESAFLGTLPIILYHFHGVNPLSFFHNLVAVPILCGITVPLSLAGAFLPYGEILLKISDLILTGTVRLLDFLNYGYIYPLFRPVLLEILIYYALCLSVMAVRKRVARFFIFFVLVPLILLHGAFEYDKRYGERLCVSFLDVGIGESILIEAPRGLRMVIDSGGVYRDYNAARSIITPVLLAKKIRTIDYLFLTHPHKDHVGGVSTILENFKVKNLLTTRDIVRDPSMIELIDMAKRRGINLYFLSRGDGMDFWPDFYFIVLNPPKNFLFEDPNDNSLVFKLTFKDVSFLFTGDITERVENMLVSEKVQLKADCLKVPHHGSSTSSSFLFIQSVSPRVAVASGSLKGYNLPQMTLLTYKLMGIPLLTTSAHGCVVICSDGKVIKVKTLRKSSGEL